jgi:hypothetical protein
VSSARLAGCVEKEEVVPFPGKKNAAESADPNSLLKTLISVQVSKMGLKKYIVSSKKSAKSPSNPAVLKLLDDTGVSSRS